MGSVPRRAWKTFARAEISASLAIGKSLVCGTTLFFLPGLSAGLLASLLPGLLGASLLSLFG